MTDIFSPSKRRSIMQAVRRQRTRPEEVLAKLLRKSEIKFRRNVDNLPGKPDFYVSDAELAIFVHGCFWHGHKHCLKGRSRPKTNKAYWKAKVDCNQKRDRRVQRKLRSLGISVYTVWECELFLNGLPKRFISRIFLSK